MFFFMALSLTLVIALMGVVSFSAAQNAAVHQVDAQLDISWRLVKDALSEASEEQYPALVKRLGESTELRVTLIKSDGTVLADSGSEDGTVPENHLHREEVQVALRGDDGVAQRFSVTEHRQMRYFARAWNGRILRVSAPVSLLSDYTRGTLTVILVSTVVAVLLSVLFVFIYTRSVLEPLNVWTKWAEEVVENPMNPPSEPEHAKTRFSESIRRLVERLSGALIRASHQTVELETVLSGMSSGLIALTPQRGVVMMNRQARKWFNVNRFEPGTDLLVLTQQSALSQLLIGQGEVQLNLRGQSIAARWMPVNEGGELWGLIWLEDVSEKLGSEIMRREFASNVSHEMRTPLAAIQGATDSLRAPDVAPEERERLLDMIEHEVSWLTDLMRDLLTLSRVESMYKDFERETLSLQDVVRDVVRAESKIAEDKGVKIDAQGVADIHVSANYARLRQLISNLVDNAVKYNVPGGSVVVSAWARGDMLHLSVWDSGIGIPKDKQARVFERFYRADESHSRSTLGTGLGLSIVKHIVRLYSGTMKLTSSPGSTEFMLHLPIVVEE
jgi:two-component system phosphate regulon sensor histidine kinase PhoR